jgi:hypothetical protein
MQIITYLTITFIILMVEIVLSTCGILATCNLEIVLASQFLERLDDVNLQASSHVS